MRRNGMLLPIASLPSPYGIGGFSKEAYEFIDLLEETGQKLWQILPLGLPAMEIPHINPFYVWRKSVFYDLDTRQKKAG